LNAPRFRRINKAAEKLEARELEEMDFPIGTESTHEIYEPDFPIETKLTRYCSRVWTFGSERPVIRLNRTKVTPFPKNQEVKPLEDLVCAKSHNDEKYDRRLRGCAPCTSKSSPFSNIS